jgi:predicted transposase YbfD/YdcC
MAAHSLLDPLDPTGTLVTGDALHCQTETARLIAGRGSNWECVTDFDPEVTMWLISLGIGAARRRKR